MMIQVLLWAPLAAGLLACAVPPALVGWVAVAGPSSRWSSRSPSSPTSTRAASSTVDESWIPDLGVRYQLGVDGISLFLVVLTAVALARGDGLVGDPRPGAGAPGS